MHVSSVYEKKFRQRLVLVLSTKYHTHPGCTQTPIEINCQSTLSNIHPCNSIHSVSIEACFQCIDVMHVSSVSEEIVLAKTCSCSFYPVSYTPWVFSNTNGNIFSINTLKDTLMKLDSYCISKDCFHCIDVMHVISVSEKIVLAKTCSCSFYPVSYTPWVYSNTNRNAVSINTPKDTPMKLDSHCLKTNLHAMTLCTLFQSLKT